jgi:hypothetical protein
LKGKYREIENYREKDKWDYVDTINVTRNLQTYLKSEDSQLNNIPTQLENISIDLYKLITNLTTIVSQYDNISSNFTTQLNSIALTFNNKLTTLKKLISSFHVFSLSADNMNYININNTAKTW